jgi:hypothetical protein
VWPDDDYLLSLGKAVYAFAYLEWGIIYLAHDLNPGERTLHRSAAMTAGQVASELRSAIRRTTRSEAVRADARDVLAGYGGLIPRRNDILHAHPATFEGVQRLRRGGPIHHDDFASFTRDCLAVSSQASVLFWSLRRGETS